MSLRNKTQVPFRGTDLPELPVAEKQKVEEEKVHFQ